jgi:hypothetical protein
VWAEMGKTWQPFGGAGYFVVLGLLVVATLLAAGLVLLPVAASRTRPAHPIDDGIRGQKFAYLLYFGWIGMAYLLVEIPLIQQYILYLGQPAYAMTVVLFSLLLFSGVGSRMATPDRAGQGLVVLVGLLLVYPDVLPSLTQHTLGLTFGWRLLVCVLTVAPIGLLMGMPFPAGIELIDRLGVKAAIVLEGRRLDGMEDKSQRAALTPWVWGVNGAASVIAAVFAAMLALSFGFSWVLWTGAGCYTAAWLTWRMAYSSSASGATES